MNYWVCKKSDDHSNALGKWVGDFKTLRHYFLIYSDEKGEAEIWQSGFFKDINVTEKFKELNRKYMEAKSKFTSELRETLDIDFED